MSLEAPVQPVPARRYPVAIVLFGVLLILAGALLLGLSSGAASGPGGEAASALPRTSAVPSSPAASARAVVPSPTSFLYRDPPSADRFVPIWSVVGVRELERRRYAISQADVEPRGEPRTGLLEASTCDLGPAADVGFLPAGELRLLGVVVPRAGHGWIRLSLLDGTAAGAFAVIVSYPPGTQDLAVGLFGVSAYSLWPRGGYRFYAVDDSGTGRYLYACLGG